MSFNSFNGNIGGWFPSVSAPNPASGVQGLYNSYNESQNASRNANAQMGQQTMDWWNTVMQQQRNDLNQAGNYLHGTNKANIRDIDKQFSKLQGETTSGLIDRGLGNSTIQYSMNKGIQNAHSDALSRSRAEFGSRLANFYKDAAGMNLGAATSGLGYLSGINIGYPDMGAYAQMAGMAGMGAGGGSGGGGSYIGDMSRPIGGAGPTWAAYGGVGTDAGVAGGSWGGMGGGGYIPTTSEYAQQQMQQQGGGGGGMWGPLYAAVQTAGQAAPNVGGYFAGAENYLQNQMAG